ncbi:phosphonate ABC transporter ATP-binding protein [Fulvitalea axinellae]|uniref:Phosphonate ABC transporter ATP-binding protein n=2 Tax=Fulvitalea axinellae TaxID=1182444 RepID=A0AAU9CTE8_9BACT|nr:phosphonate ABC transporter ATP-binding protein [Fulvitalea axinellae]
MIVASLAWSCSGQKEKGESAVKVSFSVRSVAIDSSAKMYVTGSGEELGFWSPDKVAMEYVGNNTWRTELAFGPKTPIEYKFTLGSWEREAAGANGLPLENFNLLVNADTAVSHEVHFWKDGKNRPQTGQITGTVKYFRQLEAEGILPRDVIVRLPEGYDEQPNRRYPVLYMHDGQNIFDPKTSSFGVDWQVDETVDSLVRRSLIEPVIVVGAYNTTNRTAEYTPGETGSAYMKFMAETLKPLIDKEFRTKPEREHTIVGGSSAGGIASFMLLWEYPEVYSGAICMSPAFKIQHIDYVKNVKAYKGEKRDFKIYIDNGGIGLELELQPGIDEMVEALEAQGYKQGEDLYYILDKNAKHFESAWAERMPEALVFFYK